MGAKPRKPGKPTVPTTVPVAVSQQCVTLTAECNKEEALTKEPATAAFYENLTEAGIVLLFVIIETMPPWYFDHLDPSVRTALARVRRTLEVRGLIGVRNNP